MKIVLIGSGNLAMHLGPALKKTGHQIVQVVGRTEKNAIRLPKNYPASTLLTLKA